MMKSNKVLVIGARRDLIEILIFSVLWIRIPNRWLKNRQRIFLCIASLIICLLFDSCKKDNSDNYIEPPPISGISADAAVQWADMTLYTFRYSRFNTPTYSSRSLGYLGLAMYES